MFFTAYLHDDHKWIAYLVSWPSFKAQELRKKKIVQRDTHSRVKFKNCLHFTQVVVVMSLIEQFCLVLNYVFSHFKQVII